MLIWLLNNLPKLMVTRSSQEPTYIEEINTIPWDKNKYDANNVLECVRTAMKRKVP